MYFISTKSSPLTKDAIEIDFRLQTFHRYASLLSSSSSFIHLSKFLVFSDDYSIN
jgi:hypothetical protein